MPSFLGYKTNRLSEAMFNHFGGIDDSSIVNLLNGGDKHGKKERE